MLTDRFAILALAATLSLAACGGDKVQPSDDSTATDKLPPGQREALQLEEFKKRQAAFADSVLQASASTRELAEKLGGGYHVGSVRMRDSLVKWIGRTPECYKGAKEVDPYLAGTVTFRIHMSVIGSDNVRIQQSNWTSQAGSIADKCFNDAAMKWKFPMGLAEQGFYLLQIQFK